MKKRKRIMAKTKKANDSIDIQAAINKLQGANTLVTLSDMNYDTERISTGIMSLDYILNGGLPKGKIALAWGPEGAAKSCIATQFAAQAQKEGKVIYIDLENALDPHKAENSGVDLNSLLIAQPGSAEETMELVETALGFEGVSAIIVDSVAAMATEAEINGDMGDAHVAGLARLMSQGLRKINQTINDNKSETILFFVNQQREAIGGFSPGGGTPKTTPGGKALRYYSATTMEVARIGNIKQGEEIVGQTSQVTLKKSKFAAPFQKAAFDIYWDQGVSNESTIIDLAVRLGRIDKGGGGWMSDTLTGEKLGQGKPNVIAHLQENLEYAQELQEFVLSNT